MMSKNTATKQPRLSQLTPVRMHVHILAWADSREELPEIKQQISVALTQLGATPRLETVGAPQLLNAGIPGNADQLPIQDTFITFLGQAACFLIKDRLDRDSASDFGIRFCDRHSGLAPPCHDISDEAKRKQWVNNLNKAVLASSGGGKTYLMLLMIRSYFDQDAHIVIVDIGGSYRRLCTLLKKVNILPTPNRNRSASTPFRLDKDELADTEKKGKPREHLLLTLWKKTRRDLSPEANT